MPDTSIVNRQTASAPKDYTLPQSQEVLLKAVRAEIDGTSAGSAFLPALQLLNPNGDVMWTAIDRGNSVAGGGTASVTWFHGLGGGSTGALSNPGLMACRVNITGNQAILADGNNHLVTWGEAPIDTGTPTSFWNAGTPTRLTAPISGSYLSLGNLNWDIINEATNLGHYIYLNGTSGNNFLYEFNDDWRPSASAASNGFILMGGHHGLFHLNAGDYLETQAYVQPSAGVPASVNLIDLRNTQNHYTSWSLVLVATP